MDTPPHSELLPRAGPRKGCLRVKATESSTSPGITNRISMDMRSLSSEDHIAMCEREHATETFTNSSFRIPAKDENIQRSTHPSEDLTNVFPNDDDGFLVVRQFLYTALTTADWGISMYHPELVRATVQNWHGTGYFLRRLFEDSKLENICPDTSTLYKHEAHFYKIHQRDLVANCIRHAMDQILKPNDSVARQTSLSYSESRPQLPTYHVREKSRDNVHDDGSTMTRVGSPRSVSPAGLRERTQNKTNSLIAENYIVEVNNFNRENRDEPHTETDDVLDVIESHETESAPTLKPRRSFQGLMRNLSPSSGSNNFTHTPLTSSTNANVTDVIRFEDAVHGEPPQLDPTQVKKRARRTVHRSVCSEGSPRSRNPISDLHTSSEDGSIQENASKKRRGVFTFGSGETNTSVKGRGILLSGGRTKIRQGTTPTNPRKKTFARRSGDNSEQGTQQLSSQNPNYQPPPTTSPNCQCICRAHTDPLTAHPLPKRRVHLRDTGVTAFATNLPSSITNHEAGMSSMERSGEAVLAMNEMQNAIQDIEASMLSLDGSTTPELEMAYTVTPASLSPVTPNFTDISFQFDRGHRERIVRFEANNGGQEAMASSIGSKPPPSQSLRWKMRKGLKALRPAQFR